MYYNSSAGKFRCYEDGSWKDCIQDMPETQFYREGAVQTITSSSMTPTSPAAEGTFVAPRSGKVKIDMFARWDIAAAADRMEAGVEVREDNSSGTIVSSPAVAREGIDMESSTTGSTFHDNEDGWAYVSGLTPGATYWAQIQFDTAGQAFEIEDQSILITPLP